MSVDLKLLGSKIKRYRTQFATTVDEMTAATGITRDKLVEIENGIIEPTGDEILIIADFFHCDYNFFISNEFLTALEQTETLFRRYENDLNKHDRWAIQEVLYLADCETYLDQELKIKSKVFDFVPKGDYFKGHGKEAAEYLRKTLDYSATKVSLNIYKDFREIGVKIFRRKLNNRNISGIFIKHPVAGNCVIVNYDEDVFRQRFTAAHEAGHAIFDAQEEIYMGFTGWTHDDLKEVRANAFASHYLFPRDFIANIPDNKNWDENRILEWSYKLKVNPIAFCIALKEDKKIDYNQYNLLKNLKIPKDQKDDPELLSENNIKSFNRMINIIEMGLSTSYIQKCFRAYESQIVTLNKMMDMMFVDFNGLKSIFSLFGKEPKYD